ncbi:hypothetical protein O9G_001259 [Rozella allomycis CSF55]|uniref:Uncharacterized protein n=1 Tax=Rozella allomycis (strain CSF55) TaxID=988480 RepID=A0A075ATC7_ROZAC|nr:hypothetical protein O9G_001259 [Rozella allomycis CSF55]|eukprot:EPZ33508.1 hypothetical protein O9G_001259 [Rozella allomycis CSF55]
MKESTSSDFKVITLTEVVRNESIYTRAYVMYLITVAADMLVVVIVVRLSQVFYISPLNLDAIV